MSVFAAISVVYFDGADVNDAWAKGQAEWIHDNTKVLTGQTLVVPGTAGEKSSYCYVFEMLADGTLGSWSLDAVPVWRPGVPVKGWHVNDIGVVTDGTPTGEGVQPGAWAVDTAYVVDQVVSYSGANYRCLQAHTSQAGWEPPNVPALWVAI